MMDCLKNGNDAGALVQAILVQHQGVLLGVNTMPDGAGGGVYKFIFFIIDSVI
jgi:hypothetical protein